MRGFSKRLVASLLLFTLTLSFGLPSAQAAEKKNSKSPGAFMSADAVGLHGQSRHPQEMGRQVRHQDRPGAGQRLRRVINQYTAGKFDACGMTNMDALTIPAAGGVDTTALIVGDFSNGNDGIVLKGSGKKLADIKGQKVNMVELSCRTTCWRARWNR